MLKIHIDNMHTLVKVIYVVCLFTSPLFILTSIYSLYMFYGNSKQHYRRLNATFSIKCPLLGTLLSLHRILFHILNHIREMTIGY